MRRAFFLICVALLGSVGLAAPAAGSTTKYAPDALPTFTEYPSVGITCPYPWLATGFGPLSMCTELAGAVGGAGWYGPFSSGVPDWANDLELVNDVLCVNQDAPATDGVRATVITAGRLDAGGFGEVRPGVQYRYDGAQPVGRPGNWAADGQFHPTGGWLDASDAFETTYEGCY